MNQLNGGQQVDTTRVPVSTRWDGTGNYCDAMGVCQNLHPRCEGCAPPPAWETAADEPVETPSTAGALAVAVFCLVVLLGVLAVLAQAS